MANNLKVRPIEAESIEISTESRLYTFEATRLAKNRCRLKVTVSTQNLSPYPSLTDNPGRHEFRERESVTFADCFNGMYDIVRDDRVMKKAVEWIETMPS